MALGARLLPDAASVRGLAPPHPPHPPHPSNLPYLPHPS